MSGPDSERPNRLGPYTLLSKLGEGGMGEVYLARDPRLERKVALKVLPQALRGDPERRLRLLREARAVAQLSHPHITAIHEVGEADGHDFIAFEYVDGRTLAELLAERRPSLQELVDLALPLADAIAYAHERGVLHRDLKPGNVMVTSRGHPKLLDFGLAKRLEEGSDGERRKDTTLTEQGAVFGTPKAMSPEQALGRAVDVRSDVFSFGSLLHELATGRPAFAGDTAMEVIDAVIHADPPSLAQARPDLPPAFAAIVEKALRKDPSERFQTMADLAADLRHLKRATETRSHPPARRMRTGWLVATIAGAVAAAVAFDWLFLGRGSPPAPGTGYVAVLYFENKIDPSDADQLGDMLTHLVTTDLARDPSLSVLSQQRLGETARQAGHADGRVEPGAASEIAAAAGISTMILGRVARIGDQLMATASVVDTATGRELATGQAKAVSEEDVFGLAEALGGELRKTLRAGGAEGAIAGGAERVTTSVDAYREFVSGFEAMQKLDPAAACAHFAAATELDPRFAQAYYWDAIASAWAGDSDRQLRSIERANAFRERLPPEDLKLLPAALLYHRATMLEARPALENFVAANPDSRDAWYMLGELFLHSPANADAARAARAFEEVHRIDPQFSVVDGHLVHAWFLAGNQALADQWRARLSKLGETDPLGSELLLPAWGEDLERLEPAARRYSSDGDEHSLFHRYLQVFALQAAIARGDWGDPAVVSMRARIADGGLRLRTAPGRLLFFSVAIAHQMLVLKGSFGEALALEGLLPEPSTLQGQNGFEAGMLADAYLACAYLRELTGKVEEGLSIVDRVCAAIEVPRVRWQGVALALRLGRGDAARAHLAALEALVARGAPRAGYYLELARAELDLAEGRAAEARGAFEKALAPDRVLADCFAHAIPPTGRVLDGLRRAERALGDRAAELALLRRIVARRMLRAWDPIVWLRAQLELGEREVEAGNFAEGRHHLESFLTAWDESGLSEVARARTALSEARNR